MKFSHFIIVILMENRNFIYRNNLNKLTLYCGNLKFTQLSQNAGKV